MHGVKRVAGGLPAEQLAERRKKADTYNKLTTLAFKYKEEAADSPEAVKLNTELLSINPDCYSLWAHRKTRVLSHVGKHEEGSVDDEAMKGIVAKELTLSATAILKNPKSYSAWHHRLWIIQNEVCRRYVSLPDELVLCGRMLDADERNFHCWNYRRSVASLAHVPISEELAYTLQRIRKNFSNYSAWHYRSILLTRKFAGGGVTEDFNESVAGTATPANVALPVDVLREEAELLLQALYTEPDDQSAWFYQRWVVDRLFDVIFCKAEERNACFDILATHTAAVADLIVEEPTCKWPLLALAHVAKILSGKEAEWTSLIDAAADKSSFFAQLRDNKSTLASEYFERASKLDAMRSTCYHYLAAQPSA